MLGATGVVFSDRCTEDIGEEGAHAIKLGDEVGRRSSVFWLA